VSPTDFDYHEAFSRNIGWVTRTEQHTLSAKRVAIAGVGGVGGFHALALARLGIQKFSLADPDAFELANFNRQAGAMMSTIGERKVQVVASQVKDINPNADIRVIDGPVAQSNIDAFLEGVDLYVDGLDFFAFEARRMVFAQCRARGIPVVTAAPLGMGTAVLVFLPNSTSAEDYFGFDSVAPSEWPLHFLIGLAPAVLQRGYLVDKSTVDFATRRGPSTAMACFLCAGVAATESLKILLGRGEVRAAPHGYQFDAFTQKFVRTWRPGGFKNPLQQLTIKFARAQIAKQ
jgi:molybdopterin/thiamine biosynthesis adenylyltransferase